MFLQLKFFLLVRVKIIKCFLTINFITASWEIYLFSESYTWVILRNNIISFASRFFFSLISLYLSFYLSFPAFIFILSFLSSFLPSLRSSLSPVYRFVPLKLSFHKFFSFLSLSLSLLFWSILQVSTLFSSSSSSSSFPPSSLYSAESAKKKKH